MNEFDTPKHHGGVAPYGYQWLGGKLVVNEIEAEVRRLVCELFLKHRRKKTVARLLNDLGFRTRGAALFSDTTVGRILTDPTGMGELYVNGEILSVEPIISIDTWHEVRKLLAETKPAKQTHHLFTGVVTCSCRGKMAVPGNSRKYSCSSCRRKIPAEDLEEIFHTQLEHVWPELELHTIWHDLSRKEQRLILEQTSCRIVVDTLTVKIEFGYSHYAEQLSHEYPCGEPSSSPDSTDRASEEPDPISEALLGEADAAKLLGVSRMTLLRKRNAGEISFFQVGRRILFSKEKHLKPYLKGSERRR